jgi:hypothetical protein
MHLTRAKVHALTQDDLGLLGAGHLVNGLAIDADRCDGDALALDRQAVEHILEALGLACVLFQAHDRQAIITQYVIDEREHYTRILPDSL